MYKQKTTYANFISDISNFLYNNLLAPWKIKSIGLTSLLIGYYFASSFTAYYLQKLGQRVFLALALTLFIELLIRLKSYSSNKLRLIWAVIDNFRIGITYSIVLEAFKLGS